MSCALLNPLPFSGHLGLHSKGLVVSIWKSALPSASLIHVRLYGLIECRTMELSALPNTDLRWRYHTYIHTNSCLWCNVYCSWITQSSAQNNLRPVQQYSIPRLESNLFFFLNKFHCKERCVSERAMISDKTYGTHADKRTSEISTQVLDMTLQIGVVLWLGYEHTSNAASYN
jgi:hypothetical protein